MNVFHAVSGDFDGDRDPDIAVSLVNTTATIAALTLVVLILALAVIWRLWRRSLRLREQARESEPKADREPAGTEWDARDVFLPSP